MEPRQLLAAVTYAARQDGFARDVGLDGTFDTLTMTGEVSVREGDAALFEFDTGPPAAGQIITNPHLMMKITDVGLQGTIIDFYGYSGDGAVTLEDATRPGVLLGTNTLNTYAATIDVPLDLATLQTLRGTTGKIGVRAVTRQGFACIVNSEYGGSTVPRITYDLVNTIPQRATLDFERLSHTGSRISRPINLWSSSYSPSYSEEGYSVGGPFTVIGSQTTGNYVGSTTLTANYSASGDYSAFEIKRIDGAAFTLKSLDLAKFGINEPDAYVLFTGTKINGAIVEQAGWASHFQLRTEEFAGFDNLRSLSWSAPKRFYATDTQSRYQIDNIVLESLGLTAPEPSVPVVGDQQFTVNEESPAGTVVGQIAGLFTYSLISSSVPGAFTVDSSGRILVGNPTAIDFLLTPTIELFVQATQGYTEVDVATVRIHVQDVITGPYDRLSPSTDGTKVGTTVTTTAPNLNINQSTGSNGAQGLIEFSRGTIAANEIQAATLQIYVDSKFTSNYLAVQAYVGDGSLDGNEVGSVTLWSGYVAPGWNAIPLDAASLRTFATGSHFGFALRNVTSTTGYISDYEIRSQEHPSGFGPRLKILRYANSAPVLDDVTWTVPENSTSIPNSTLVATDANPRDTLTYSLLSSSVPGAFGVNSNGNVYVANRNLLNFEVNPTITLTVQVTDSGSYPALTDTATVTINLTDVNEGPVLSAAPSFVVPENSPAGTVLGTVPFTPDPEGDAITFSLNTPSDTFEIDTATGQLRVKAGANPNRLNFESQSSGSLSVRVQDSKGYSTSYTYYYQLTNVAEPPSFPWPVHTITAGEFLPAGSVLMTLPGSDQDSGSILTYSIDSVVGAPAGAVAVNPTTGKLTVVDPTAFNTEVRTQFTVNVRVSDNTSPAPLSSTMAVVINLTTLQDIAVPEYSTNVGTVLAPASFGASRTYSILSGNGENRVSINSTTGLLTATDIDSLQFRESPSIQLVVRISDGVRTFDRTVRIALTPLPTRYQNFALNPIREYIGTPDSAGQRTWTPVISGETVRIQGGSGTQSRVAITPQTNQLFYYSDSPFLKLTVLGTQKLATEAETVLEIYATEADESHWTSLPNEAARGYRVGRLVLQAGDAEANRTYLIPLEAYDYVNFSSYSLTTLTVRNDTNANIVTLAGSPILSPAGVAFGPAILRPIEIFARDSYSHPFFVDTASQDGGKIFMATADGYVGPTVQGRSLPAGTWWRLDEGFAYDDGYSPPYPSGYKLLGQQSDGTWTYIEYSGSLYPNWSRQSFPVNLSAQSLIKGNFVANDGYGNSLAGRDASGQWWIIQRGYYSPNVQSAGGSWSTSTSWTDIVSGDFDGDGFDEVAGRDAATGLWTVSKFTATGMIHQNWGAWSTATTWSDVQVGDFNGDGRTDILGRAADGQIWLSRSFGTGFVTSAFGAVSATSTWAETFVGDFDHDQRMDLLVRNVAGEWWLARTNRNTFDIEKVGQWAATGSWSQGTVYNGWGYDYSSSYSSSAIVTIESATNRMWYFHPQSGQTRVSDLYAPGDSPIQLLGENRPVTVPERGGPVTPLTGTASAVPPRYRRTSSWGQLPTPLAETYTAPPNESVPASPKVLSAGTNPDLITFNGYPSALDGNTLAVSTADGIEVYIRTGSTWTQQATLRVENSTNFVGLSIEGDLLVALDATHNAYEIFERSGTTWKHTGRVLRSEINSTYYNRYGRMIFNQSIACDGDLITQQNGIWTVGSIPQINGDNFSIDGDRLAVTDSYQKLVTIYERISGQWTYSTEWFYGVAGGYSDVGRIVLSGDRLFVSDPYVYREESTLGYQSGTVLVYQRDGSRWNLVTQLWPAHQTGNEFSSQPHRFGQGLAVSGNFMAVTSQTGWGRVELFELQNGIWTPVAQVPMTDHQAHLTIVGRTVLATGSRNGVANQLFSFPYSIVAPASQTFDVKEQSDFGTVVGSMAVSPPVGQSVTYSIIAGNTGDVFAIDPVTGVITVKRGNLLDFETTSTYSLTVQVLESGGATATAIATVNLVNLAEPTSQIIDNGGAGFSTTGTWTSEATGRGGTVLRAVIGPPASTASWRFTGLTTGVYRLATTWSANTNRTTGALYSIKDGAGTTLSTKTFNQRLAPTEFVQDGSGWRTIDTVTVTENDGVLEAVLSTGTILNFYIADAVRLDRVGVVTLTPEVEISANGSSLVDGTSTLDFGTVAFGELASRDLRITNRGAADLTVTGVNLPAGFVLRNALPTNLTLGPGDNYDFTVFLQDATAGAKTGTLSIQTNDADESSFDIALTGTISPQVILRPQLRFSVDGVEIPLVTGVLDFGTTTFGTTVSKTVRIENVGTARLDSSYLSSLELFANNWNQNSFVNFRIEPPTADYDGLAPGESTTFTITFLANAPYMSRDRVSVNWENYNWSSDVPNIWSFNVRGSVPSGALTETLPRPTFSATPGQTTTGIYTFQNQGDLPVTLQPATISGTDAARFAILSNFTAGQIVNPGQTVMLTVQFTGGPIGKTEFATLTISASGLAVPNINLFGTTLAPEISVTSFSLALVDGVSVYNIGTFRQGITAIFEILVRNTGTSDLVLQPATVPSGFIIVQNFTAGQVLAINATATLRIQIDSSTVGTFVGTLSFANNDPDESPFDVQLQSTIVTAPEIDVQVSGSSVASGGTIAFGTSAGTILRKTFRILNTGNATLAINQPYTSQSSFRVLTPIVNGTTIAAGSWLDIEVEFQGSLAGNLTSSLVIANNDSNESSYIITLTGTMQSSGTFSLWDGGTDITSTYLYSSYPLGNTPRGTELVKTFTIKNPGTTPLALGTPTISGTGFSILDSLPVSLPAGSQVNFRVRFFSSTATTSSGTLTLITSDSLRFTINRPLSATARTLPEISVIVDGSPVSNGGTIGFGAASPGQSINKSIIVRNDGTDPLNVNYPQVTGTGWRVLSGSTGLIQPGQSVTWTIQRDGYSSGLGNGTLRIYSDDFDEATSSFVLTGVVPSSGEIAVSLGGVDIVSDVTVADFGLTRVGTPVTQTFVLSNPSATTLYLGTPTIPGDYTLLDALPATLAPGDQFTFRVQQNATFASSSAISSSLFIPSSDFNESPFRLILRQMTHSVGEIAVTMNGVDAPSGSSLDFGSTSFGSPVTRTFTVWNYGVGPLSIGAMTMPPGFQVISGNGPATLQPGASRQIQIRLDADRPWTGPSDIYFSNNDTDEPWFTIRATGTVAASGEIQISESGANVPNGTYYLPFPATAPGLSSTKTFVVTNSGTTPLLLAPATATGPFTFDSNFTVGQSLAPGASATLVVRATPTYAGNSYGNITITSSDSDESPFFIGVTVNATYQVIVERGGAFLPDNTGVVDFGTVEIGNVAEQTIILRNARTTALTLQPAIAPAGFTIVQNFTAGQVVPAGGTAQLIVRMITSAKTIQSGQIAFQTNDTSKPVYDFRVMGNVIYSSVPTAPTVTGPMSFSFEEFSPRWTVPGRVTTDDINGDRVTYSILSGNPDDTLYLSPDGPDAGKIWVNKQDLTGLRHRGMFNLRIRATDTSAANLYTDFDVQVFITPAAATTSVSSSNDGSILDTTGNGFDAGDTVNSTGPGLLVQGGTSSSRGVLEFDLSNLPTTRVLKNAWLFFSTSSLVGGTIVSVPIDIYGYSGNGTIEAGDAALGTKIGTRPISNADGSNQLKVHSAPLDAAFVRSLIGTGKLGLVLRNDGTSDGVVINSSEAGVTAAQKPYLALQFSDLKPDLVVRDVGASGTGNSLLTLTSAGTSFTVNTANVFGTGQWEQFVTGDFNGDGHNDIAARDGTTGEWWVSLVNSGVPQTATVWGVTSPSATWNAPLIADFDGDGKADIAARNTAGEWWVLRSTGSALDPKLWGTWDTTTTWQNVVAADFNRDGRTDIAGRNSSGQWFVARSTGSSPATNTFATSQWGLWSTATTWSDVQVGDFNGDGRADITGRSAIGQWWVNRSTGTSFAAALFYGNWSTGTTWSDVRMADFNGDGRDDIVGRTTIGQWWVAEVGTSGFVMKLLGTWSGPQTKWSEVTVGDFNRDGRADLTVRNNVTHEVWTSLWSPTGFTTTAWAILPNGAIQPWRLLGTL